MNDWLMSWTSSVGNSENLNCTTEAPIIENEQMEQKLTNGKAYTEILHKSGLMVSALINSGHNVT